MPASTVRSWTILGMKKYSSGGIGIALELERSETVFIPVGYEFEWGDSYT